MPVNGTEDRDTAGNEGMGAAGEHLLCVREAVAGYAEYAGLTMAEILLPSMSAQTRRHASGQALMELLRALDPPGGTARNGENGSANRAPVPFLVCALEHPPTGLRVALLAAAVSAT
ncbi:MAG TPA: hypothetical protein VFU43_06985 [Streptosporangiaceae bacterium]|nr:hypothetical protein [Streptosporangiaceae bacterium]